MTHDELLAICDNYSFKDSAEPVKALRAVVELHKVLLVKNYEDDTDWYECQECSGNGFIQPYPCPTIQSIEKELQ